MDKNNMIQNFILATKTVLKHSRAYRLWFGILAFVIFMAYLLLPVWLTPGNTLGFQLSLLRVQDYVLFVLLSIVTSLLMVMQYYVYANAKKKKVLSSVGEGGVSVYSAMFAGLMATAACSSCIAGLIGFLGAGSVFFVLEYQWYFVFGAFLIVLISLHFTARRVCRQCVSCCEVKPTDQHK